MPSLIQGRVVYARIPISDPQGRNPKSNRPFVVITHDDDIKANSRVQCVAVTDETHSWPEDHYYPLPPNSGCSPGSAALCTWIESLDKADIDIKSGFVKPKSVFEIIAKVKDLKEGEFQSRAPGEPKPTS